ncbi:MAG: hypothetical protein A2W61_08110 [Deltaproteobacteria bacterium RIFCSPLOWO2_01_44_7]|nr:MAG: hypothetical protein A2712_10490 [Deltaproteobacteria bacterium RIFCSPHIGHO2_01_FULL_43_49]OGQ15535.1 MAG: hypothetical protein A3D22_11020 [Deltaproteobacteria bacterium RIFCSPHIGHO2_02_FULL_44_53]OGQ28477.1 MAG: hypothetical protein A3D98_03205 [Deltaproteobacteria bacterium RIFCSPHIGHO2_12_FULL_44_21]OGQ32341.1 MAG: hypothetical protein A2979_00865 [Deltaproteobacteria bacterium RIFCSPLOWO2_01_FULL_45_74]OGQ37703.1 MAG: hypothetical protein A2W61_08110 [Deltaproteobacteria bacterium 
MADQKRKFEFTFRDKIKYADCDMHQHLNHAKYLSFLEQARVEYFGKLGFKATHDFRSIPFIVAAAHCDYKAPAYLNDEILIEMGTTSFGNTSFRIDYEMKHAKTGKLIAQAYTILVMYDYDKMKPVSVPENLKKEVQKLKA